MDLLDLIYYIFIFLIWGTYFSIQINLFYISEKIRNYIDIGFHLFIGLYILYQVGLYQQREIYLKPNQIKLIRSGGFLICARYLTDLFFYTYQLIQKQIPFIPSI